MKKVLIATHAHMASGIVSSLDLLTGKGSEVSVLDAYVNDTDVKTEFHTFLDSLSEEDQGIVFTDWKGGSVNQLAVNEGLASGKNITVITGINLPVVLEIVLATEELNAEKLESIVEMARQELCVMSISNTEKEETSEEEFFG